MKIAKSGHGEETWLAAPSCDAATMMTGGWFNSHKT
jgi:hypothetical protein